MRLAKMQSWFGLCREDRAARKLALKQSFESPEGVTSESDRLRNPVFLLLAPVFESAPFRQHPSVRVLLLHSVLF